MQQPLRCWCPRRTGLPFMNSFLRRGWWWPRRMPKHPELGDKNVPDLHVMKAMFSLKSRGYLKEVCLETLLLVPHQRGHPLSPQLPPPAPWDHACQPCAAAVLRLAGRGPKVWRESNLQDSHEEKQTETPTDKAPCPLVPTEARSATEFQFRGGFGRGCGQPPQ